MLKVIKYIRSRKPDINIWVYTGFLFEDISSSIREIDVLVDGKFILEEKDISLKFRGSANQRVVDIKKSLQNNKADTIIIYLKMDVISYSFTCLLSMANL